MGRIEKFGRWCRRNPVVASLTGLVALVLIVGIVVSWYFAAQASKRERQATRRLYVADMRMVQQSWEEDQRGRMRDLLDGETPDKTNGTDLRGFEWYYWDRQELRRPAGERRASLGRRLRRVQSRRQAAGLRRLGPDD